MNSFAPLQGVKKILHLNPNAMTRLFHAYPVLARYTAYFLVFLTLTFLTGCNYYRVISTPQRKIPSKMGQDMGERYFVLVLPGSAWHLDNPAFENDQLTGTLKPLRPLSQQYLGIEQWEKSNKIPKSDLDVSRDIHLYPFPDSSFLIIPPGTEPSGRQVLIPLRTLEKAIVLKKDRSTLTGVIILGALLGLVIAGSLTSGIGSGLNMFCPFVYTSDGNLFHFEGELFPGALTSELERDDYLPLPHLQPDEGSYQVVIADELMEEEYIDLAALRIVQHPEGTQVLIDQNGNAQVFGPLQHFIQAATDNGTDISQALGQKDGNGFCFDQPGSARNSVVLTFDKPSEADQVKLWLTAVNTPQMGNTLEEFASGYSPKNKETPREWMQKRGFPIAVYLQTTTGWQPCGHLQPIGPLGWRDLAAHIDLREHDGNTVAVKLEAGANLWELDYAAADFSGNTPFADLELLPRSAWATNNRSYTATLSYPDEDYLVLPGPGNHVRLEYEVPQLAPGMEQRAFLHGKGYYHAIPGAKSLSSLGQVEMGKEPLPKKALCKPK
jgi:hypothetical protein